MKVDGIPVFVHTNMASEDKKAEQEESAVHLSKQKVFPVPLLHRSVIKLPRGQDPANKSIHVR